MVGCLANDHGLDKLRGDSCDSLTLFHMSEVPALWQQDAPTLSSYLRRNRVHLSFGAVFVLASLNQQDRRID